MAMYGVIGTPGAGKTLFTMQKILPGFLKYCEQINQYREIYHNIDGLDITQLFALLGMSEKEPYWREHFHDIRLDETTGEPDEIRPRYFWIDPETRQEEVYTDYTDNNKVKRRITGDIIPPGSLVLLDEVQNIFGSRNTLSGASDQMKDFVTKHRHHKITIYWLTQHPEQVDVSFRRNTEQQWKLERLENVAFTKSGKNSAVVKKYLGWDNMDGMTPFATEHFKYDDRFYNTFRSYVKDSDGLGEEVRNTTNMWLNSTPLKVVAALFVLMIIVVCVVGNPLTAIEKAAGGRSAAAPSATPTPPSGFTPVGGGGSKPQPEKKECFTNYVIRNGLLLYYKNNEQLIFKPGVKYEKCE